MIRVTVDSAAVMRRLNAGIKQARYAAAVAITKTGKAVEKRLQTDMQQQFDRPTPWVAKGTFVKPATKQTLAAVIGMRPRQAMYVKEHFGGGHRGQKPYEKALAALGVIPSGYKAIPGAGMKLDSRGNPNRAQLKEVLGSLKSGMGRYGKRGKTIYRVGYFVIQPGNVSRLQPGVYKRINNRAITPALVFVSSAGYRKRLDLARIARDVVAKDFNVIFAAEFNKALSTAR